MHLVNVEKSLKSKLEIFSQVELSKSVVEHDMVHLDVNEETVILHDVLGCDLVIDVGQLIQELEGQVCRNLVRIELYC